MNGTMTGSPVQQLKIRYGCFPAKIGCDFNHRLEQPLTLRSGRIEAAGRFVYLTIQDITRHPEADAHVKWRCLNANCAGKHWASKKDLLAAHPPNRELERQEEIHCFMAVAYVPPVPAKEEKKDKHGQVIEPAEPAKLATVLLLSDEE